jgi:hypothetical protein
MTRLDKKKGATITLDTPIRAHSAMVSASDGAASSMCAVLTSCRLDDALCSIIDISKCHSPESLIENRLHLWTTTHL